MSKQKRSNKNAGLQSYSKVNEIAGSLAHLAKKHNLGRKKEREMVQKLVAREIAREGL